jgi:hypothetical protein
MNFLTGPMLTDHRIEQERRASRFRGRQELAKAFGKFIAGLADWDWFINPITFRDRCAPDADTVRSINQLDGITRCEPDPRLKEWSPSSCRILAGEPAPDAALAGIRKYLADLETSAGKPIGWVIGEEFGGRAAPRIPPARAADNIVGDNAAVSTRRGQTMFYDFHQVPYFKAFRNIMPPSKWLKNEFRNGTSLPPPAKLSVDD